MGKAARRPTVVIIVALLISSALGLALLSSQLPLSKMLDTITIGGIPSSIVMEFLQDETARQAYWNKDKQALHDRLQVLGVEEQMKAYYRPKIPDELKLDQYIHQIFYDRTGYVGQGYTLNAQGKLILKQPEMRTFQEWLQLAQEVGLVVGSQQKNGRQYVISPEGNIAPYETVAAIFPLAELRALAQSKQLK